MSKDSQSIIFKYLQVSHIKDVNNFSGVFRMIEFKIMVKEAELCLSCPVRTTKKLEYLNHQDYQKWEEKVAQTVLKDE